MPHGVFHYDLLDAQTSACQCYQNLRIEVFARDETSFSKHRFDREKKRKKESALSHRNREGHHRKEFGAMRALQKSQMEHLPAAVYYSSVRSVFISNKQDFKK
jgi:hypothetical protein